MISTLLAPIAFTTSATALPPTSFGVTMVALIASAPFVTRMIPFPCRFGINCVAAALKPSMMVGSEPLGVYLVAARSISAIDKATATPSASPIVFSNFFIMLSLHDRREGQDAVWMGYVCLGLGF